MAGKMFDLSQTLIGQAITMNSVAHLKQYIADGEDPLRKDRKGNTYIHFVCTMYRPFIFQFLTATGIDISAQNKHGNTALHVTALQEECCHVGDLMAAGINPDLTNKDGKMASELKSQNRYWHTIFNTWQPGIYNVIKDHDVPRLLELLHSWSRIDTTKNNQTLRQFAASLKFHDIVWILDEHKHNLDLVYGVLEVDYEKVEEALKKSKCNVNFVNKSSSRPHILQYATELQNLTLVSMLCSAGADVNTCIQVHGYHWGPLYFESINTRIQPKIMWRILESNPDFSLKDQKAVLRNLNLHNLNNENDFRIKDQRGRNALTFALDKNNGRIPLDVIEYLLKKGTYFAERDETGATIRDVARFARRRDVVDLIDKWYVKIMRRSDMNMLYQLAMDGYDSCVIQHNYRDSYIYACGNETDEVLKFIQWMPSFQTSVQSFHRLVLQDNLDSVKDFLQQHDHPKLLLNSKDKGGRAPLHIAVLWKRPEIVEFLLSHIPDLNIDVKDCCSRTAYHYACALQDDGETIRQMLLQRSIDQCIVDTKCKKAHHYLDVSPVGIWIEKERHAKYGMELELTCIDKYEELVKIISSKKKGLREFNESIKYFKHPVVHISSVLDPLMPNFKDLLFVALDYGKEEVAKKLVDLGADLTRREVYPLTNNKPVPKKTTEEMLPEETNMCPSPSRSSLTESVEFTMSSLDCVAEVTMTAEMRARELDLLHLADYFAKKLKRQKQIGSNV